MIDQRVALHTTQVYDVEFTFTRAGIAVLELLLWKLRGFGELITTASVDTLYDGKFISCLDYALPTKI